MRDASVVSGERINMEHYIGVDGGSTCTVLRVADREGKELLHLTGSALNINGNTETAVYANLNALFHEVGNFVSPAADCLGVCIGAAGVSNTRAASLLRRFFEDYGYQGPLKITGDQHTALRGAISGESGAILIAGTGSICYGRKGTREHRVGGFGHLIDDEGSGYAIARDIFAAVCRSHDGRGPKTLLSQALESFNLHTPGDIVSFLYAPSTTKRDIADYSRLIDPAYAQHDAAAEDIAGKAADALAHMALTMHRAINLAGCELALCGSILQKCVCVRECFLEACKDSLFSDIALAEPVGDAAQGAVKLAMELHDAP